MNVNLQIGQNEEMIGVNIRECPICGFEVGKEEDEVAYMKCYCGYEFCFVCGNEYEDYSYHEACEEGW